MKLSLLSRVIGIVLVSFVASASAQNAGSTITVGKDGAVLRKEKRTVSPIVAKLAKGQSIGVVKREGDWIFADASGKQGWAHEDWLAEAKGSFASMLKSADVVASGDARAATAGEAAAAKGLGPTARQFAASKGYSGAQLDNLATLRSRVIDSGEWEQFAREGKVGPRETR